MHVGYGRTSKGTGQLRQAYCTVDTSYEDVNESFTRRRDVARHVVKREAED